MSKYLPIIAYYIGMFDIIIIFSISYPLLKVSNSIETDFVTLNSDSEGSRIYVVKTAQLTIQV